MFKFDKKTANTIKMADKSRNKINSAETILRSITIPETFENRRKISESIRLLKATSNGIKSSNTQLDKKINQINAVSKKNIIFKNIISSKKSLGLNGYSDKDLDNMSYNDLNKLLGDMVLNSRNIQNMKNPLNENNDPINTAFRENNMYKYIYRILNGYTEKSVCQGGTYLDKNTIAYCDIDSDKESGKLCIVKKGILGRITGKTISSIDVNGHSNDITYVKKDRIIIHPDHEKKQINLYKLDENYNVIGRKVLYNKNADAIAYDPVRDNIIVVNGVDAEVYSKDTYLKGDKKPDSKFKVADQILDTRDKNNTTYYDYRAGATAYDGKLYISYAGFVNHVTGDESHSHGEEKGNLISILDYEKKGYAVGHIKDDIKQEIESIDFTEGGDLVTWHNYGPKTRVFETDLVNAKVIAENYNKETTIKAKTRKSGPRIKVKKK